MNATALQWWRPPHPLPPPLSPVLCRPPPHPPGHRCALPQTPSRPHPVPLASPFTRAQAALRRAMADNPELAKEFEAQLEGRVSGCV